MLGGTCDTLFEFSTTCLKIFGLLRYFLFDPIFKNSDYWNFRACDSNNPVKLKHITLSVS